jgi:hypothetical protein
MFYGLFDRAFQLRRTMLLLPLFRTVRHALNVLILASSLNLYLIYRQSHRN